MKKIKHLLSFLSLFSLAVLTVQAEAAIKVGVVDIQKALQEVKKGKKAKTELEKSMKSREATFTKQQKELEKERNEFQKKSAVLSAEARQKQGMALQKRFMELQQLGARFEAEFQQEQVKATQPILKELAEVAQDLGKSKKVDIVVEKNAGFLYASDSVELTSDLIKAYDKKYK